MSKGRNVKSWLLAGCLVLLGMFFVSEVRAEDAKGPELAPARKGAAQVARIDGLEEQLDRLEERLERYRQNQDKTKAELDGRWLQFADKVTSNISVRCDAVAQKEIKNFRKQSLSILDEQLKKAQAKHARSVKEIRKCMEGERSKVIFWGIVVFCIIVGLALIVLCILACFSKKQTSMWENVRYCFEMVLLIAVLAVIGCGSFHLLSRIVDLGAKESAILAITSPDCSMAVLQAYEQLSNELGRWCALFGVLGAFFGLVLPIGAHLLQIKTVKREEEKTTRLIQENVKVSEKDIRKSLEVEVQKIWKEYADMQYLEDLKIFKTLRDQSSVTKVSSVDSEWSWFQWISGLLYVVQILNRLSDAIFVNKRIGSLVRMLKEAKTWKTFVVMSATIRKRFQGEIIQFEGGFDSLRKKSPDNMNQLESLLNEYGIEFGEEPCSRRQKAE